MKAILIDPQNFRVSVVFHDGTIESVKRLIRLPEGPYGLDGQTLANGDYLIGDDMGLKRPYQSYFALDGVIFGGCMMILGVDNEGDDRDCRTTLADLQGRVGWAFRKDALIAGLLSAAYS